MIRREYLLIDPNGIDEGFLCYIHRLITNLVRRPYLQFALTLPDVGEYSVIHSLRVYYFRDIPLSVRLFSGVLLFYSLVL